MNEKFILLDEVNPQDLWGPGNVNLKLLQVSFPKVKIVSRGNAIRLNGSEAEINGCVKVLETMINTLMRSGSLDEDKVAEILERPEKGRRQTTEDLKEEESTGNGEVLVYGHAGKIVRARTANQKKLVEAAFKNDVVFAIGPAGTGKTYTAVAIAVKALKDKEIKKIILCRPAVEAGENLGFLPGDLKEKIDPYLRPLYDALDDMIPPDKLKSMVETRVIEIAPMAFMRGRTLDNCYVILDEAQNATDAQLKMFLTRLGPNGKMIITGDLTQIDLPKKEMSGLQRALNLLEKIKGIRIVKLTVSDVIRHKLVKEIVKAYDKEGEARGKVSGFRNS